jgi:hypothetical protein
MPGLTAAEAQKDVADAQRIYEAICQFLASLDE